VKISLLIMMMVATTCHAYSSAPLSSYRLLSQEVYKEHAIGSYAKANTVVDAVYQTDEANNVSKPSKTTLSGVSKTGSTNSSLLIVMAISLAILNLLLMRSDQRHQ